MLGGVLGSENTVAYKIDMVITYDILTVKTKENINKSNHKQINYRLQQVP